MTEERETWLVSLWLNNDETLYNNTIYILSQSYEYEHQRLDALREYVEMLTDNNIIKDKFSHDRVDWASVAHDFDEVLK
jgi:hypothetical protein